MPLFSEKLLGGASNGNTALALLLGAVHVESEGKGRLAQGSGLLLQLLKLTLRNTAELEEQATSGGRLARVNMAATKGEISNQGRIYMIIVIYNELESSYPQFPTDA